MVKENCKVIQIKSVTEGQTLLMIIWIMLHMVYTKNMVVNVENPAQFNKPR